ncbi:hypothetical protein ACQY0O_000325 [Thecaphora frezii]
MQELAGDRPGALKASEPSKSPRLSSELAEIDEGIETATIITAQKVTSVAMSPVRAEHRRSSSDDSSASGVAEARRLCRTIPPPTPPPRAALPPTPCDRDPEDSKDSPDTAKTPPQSGSPLGLGVYSVRASSPEKAAFPPPRFTGEWSQRRRHQRSYTRLSTFTEREEGAEESSEVATPQSPVSSGETSDVSTPTTEHWSSTSPAQSCSTLQSSKDQVEEKTWATEQVSDMTLTPTSDANGAAIPCQDGQPESTSQSQNHEQGKSEGAFPDRLASPPSVQAQADLGAQSNLERTSSENHSPDVAHQKRGFHASAAKSGARERAIETLLISGRLGDAPQQPINMKNRPPHRTAADFDRRSSGTPPLKPSLGLSREAQATKPEPVGAAAVALADAIRVLAYLPSKQGNASGSGGSSDEEQALRYALRFALEAADRTARLLARSQKEKTDLERQCRTLQSNLLLTEAQLGLLQEEASLVRSSRASGDPVAASSSTDVVMPTDTGASRPSPSPPTDLTSATAETNATSGSSTGCVSIAALRKARAAATAQDATVDQRYAPKRSTDPAAVEPESDEEDSDDERLGITRRPKPKEISLSDFLEASRITKEEQVLLTPQASQRSLPLLAKTVHNDALDARDDGPGKKGKFFRSLYVKGKKGAGIAFKGYGSLGRDSRSFTRLELVQPAMEGSVVSPADNASYTSHTESVRRQRLKSVSDSVVGHDLEPDVDAAGSPSSSRGMRLSLHAFLDNSSQRFSTNSSVFSQGSAPASKGHPNRIA